MVSDGAEDRDVNGKDGMIGTCEAHLIVYVTQNDNTEVIQMFLSQHCTSELGEYLLNAYRWSEFPPSQRKFGPILQFAFRGTPSWHDHDRDIQKSLQELRKRIKLRVREDRTFRVSWPTKALNCGVANDIGNYLYSIVWKILTFCLTRAR